MKVLVLNCGSSSLKCQLIDMEKKERIMKGHYDRIGGARSSLRFNVRGNKTVIEHPARDFEEAISEILRLLTSEEYKVINDLSKFDCDDSYHECYDCVGSEDCYPDEGKTNLNLGVYFRTIDLTDVFPNSQYSPSNTNTLPSTTRRNIGQNWTTSNAVQVIEEIQKLGDKVYTEKFKSLIS